MTERWHITERSCNYGRRQLDWGAFDYFWQAAEQVRKFIAEGSPGGCRCHRGWQILPCSKLQNGHGGGFIRGSDCEDFKESGNWWQDEIWN
ncbi:MAG: hypothetical protein JWO13_809 [Acidobacteriales bacterium]|nr:hypothetical protein [Terriglobales bacterium]